MLAANSTIVLTTPKMAAKPIPTPAMLLPPFLLYKFSEENRIYR